MTTYSAQRKASCYFRLDFDVELKHLIRKLNSEQHLNHFLWSVLFLLEV